MRWRVLLLLASEISLTTGRSVKRVIKEPAKPDKAAFISEKKQDELRMLTEDASCHQHARPWTSAEVLSLLIKVLEEASKPECSTRKHRLTAQANKRQRSKEITCKRRSSVSKMTSIAHDLCEKKTRTCNAERATSQRRQ